MEHLSYEQKYFIVQQLACRETPTEVARSVKEEFGITITRQAVQAYDPTKWAGRDLSAELKQLFEETRKQFDADIDAIPIANKAYRLLVLQKIIDSPAVGPVVKMQAVEQAEKMLGGLYTNKRDITSNGQSINVNPTVIELVAPDVKGADRATT